MAHSLSVVVALCIDRIRFLGFISFSGVSIHTRGEELFNATGSDYSFMVLVRRGGI